jgi:hypothetical protein
MLTKLTLLSKEHPHTEDTENAQAGTVGLTGTPHHVIVRGLRREGSRISPCQRQIIRWGFPPLLFPR